MGEWGNGGVGVGGGLGWFIWEVLQKRQSSDLSCLEVGLCISGYSLLLLFYVFFFNFKPSPCRLCSFAFSFFCISLKKLWASSIFAKLRPAL